MKERSAAMCGNGRWWIVVVALLVALPCAYAQDTTIELAPGGVKVISEAQQRELGLVGGEIYVVWPQQEGEEIAESQTADNKDILIFPRREGTTQMLLLDETGAQAIFTINVSSTPIAQQAARILEDLPSVKVTAFGEKTIASGFVSGPEEMTRVQAVCESMGLVNLVTMDSTTYDDALRENLEKRLNMPAVKLSLVKGKAILEGTVTTEEERVRAEGFVKEFFPVLNLLTISPESKTQIQADRITAAIGIEGVHAAAVEDKVLLEGAVLDNIEAERAAIIATAFVPQENIINNILVNNPMIEMDVVVAEINWSDVKGLGSNSLMSDGIRIDLSGDMNWTQAFQTNYQRTISRGVQTITSVAEDGTIDAQDVNMNTNMVDTGHSNDNGFESGQEIGFNAHTMLRAFIDAGCAKTLSQPHVSCRSGEEAYIQVGGDFGVPTVTQNTTGVEYKEFGTIVTIRPVVRKDGRILTHVEVERSTRPIIGAAGTVSQDRTRTYSDILCDQAETLVLSGLIEEYSGRSTSKTPWLHRIPGANLFFKSVDNASDRLELVIMVTPTAATIFRSDKPALSESYGRTLAQSQPCLDDLSDQTLTQFLFSCEPEEWPCRGCCMPTCRYCCAAGIAVTPGMVNSGQMPNPMPVAANPAGVSQTPDRAAWSVPADANLVDVESLAVSNDPSPPMLQPSSTSIARPPRQVGVVSEGDVAVAIGQISQDYAVPASDLSVTQRDDSAVVHDYQTGKNWVVTKPADSSGVTVDEMSAVTGQ
jgi:Flp pilus assembly secretin CpaC